ncbi:unnamed protein product [Cunninghamella echinulata]
MVCPLFNTVCTLMETINNTRGNEEKRKLVSKFLQSWRRHYSNNFYSALRLLLPHLDTTMYGVKEAKIAKAYIDALNLAKNSDDAYNLLKWKLPSMSHKAKSTGDFASIVYDVIKNRSTVTKATQTVEDVIDLLDDMNRHESNDKRKSDLFKHIINNYTPFEQRWLIRIILKDLKTGISETTIFNIYHPQARELYSVCSNLKKVADNLQNPNTRIGKTTIKIFDVFKPQLSVKGTIKDYENVQFNGKFYIEEKIDGERIQMHCDRIGQKFKWYSRNATDYTDLYGANLTVKGKLSTEIFQCLKSDNMVLDGEMVAYDPQLDVYLPFGTLKGSAKDERLESHRAHPCFIVFDIVYCNGHALIDYPLSDRIKVLNNVIKEKPGYLTLLPRQEKSTELDVVDALNHAVEHCEEGIILKNPRCRYEPGERNRNWIKIKPDYFDTLGENCDLLVIGGKYGTGRRANKIAQYMCVLRDDRVPDDEPPYFISFSMIGTGYTYDQINQFGQFFQNIQSYKAQNQPSWLNHPIRSTELPDVLVNDYQKAVVIEVKAAEIVSSNMWGSGYTLRFPRFVRFRRDKSWRDIMTYKDLIEARRGTSQKRQSLTPIDLSFDYKKRTRTITKGQTLTLNPSQQGSDVENIIKKTSLFEDKKFYVINGQDNNMTKQALEVVIKENGGEFIQRHDSSTYVIAGKKNIRVESIIFQKSNDIIYPTWILDCVQKNKLLPLAPKYMLFTTVKTEQEFNTIMDEFGDSYVDNATEESLKEIWDRIPISNHPKAIEYMQDKYFQTGIPGMFFYGIRAYFARHDNNKLFKMTMEGVRRQELHDKFQRMGILIKFYGGQVVLDALDPLITHVIIDENQDQGTIKNIIKQFIKRTNEKIPYFVTVNWIQQCSQQHTLLDETRFNVSIPSLYQQ